MLLSKGIKNKLLLIIMEVYMKKKIILTFLFIFAVLSLFGCKKKENTDTNITKEDISENVPEELESAMGQQTKIEVAGWIIDLLDHKIDTSMENVSVVLGYTDVGTNTFTKVAQDGYEYCLIKLNIEKIDSMEKIDWDKFYLTDDSGNQYTRLDDSFLSDLGMKRMPGTDLNFGTNTGWIAYEVKTGYTSLKLSYKFNEETYEYSVLTKDDIKKGDNSLVPEYVDYLEEQKKVDDNLLTESKKGYSIDNPLIVVNPYGNSPLSAIAIFDTDKETAIELTVKGKKVEDDIKTTLDKSKTHIIPIYGLYVGDTTQVIFTLDDGTKKTVDITTDSINSSVIKAEVATIDKEEYDYSNLSFVSIQSDPIYGVAAYDSAGDARLLLEGKSFPVKRLNNGNIMLSSPRILKTQYYSTGLLEMDLNGRVIHDYLIPGGYHHDFYELENGNLLVAGDPVDFSTVENFIYEIDRKTGDIVYELDLSTILDETDGGSINRTDEDWFHNNSVWYDEESNNIILSGRHVDAVIAVNKTTKKLSWILGDPTGWKNVDKNLFFTPIGDNFEWQYAQHNASVLPNGDILLFDNGAGRTKVETMDNKVTGDEVYSRAVIYHIDLDKKEVEQVWEYGKENGAEWYSSFISGASYLGEDNIWVTSGGILYDKDTNSYDIPLNNLATSNKLTHINQVKENKLVYELILNNLAYRSYRYPLYPEHVNLDLTKEGTYLGNLGETKAEDLSNIDLVSAIPSNFSVDIIHNPDRYIVNGSWNQTAKDAAIILKSNENQVIGFNIESVNSVTTTENNLIDFSTWFSPIGLEDSSYHVYIRNNGKIYDTGYSIE
jgi:arylsulfate sulfotransferase